MWGQVEVRTLADLHMLAMSTLESEKMDQGGPEDTRDKDYLDLDQPGAGKLETDRKSTRLNSSHRNTSRMPSSA